MSSIIAQYLIGVVGIVVTLGLAFIASNDRKAIRLKPILSLIVIQFIMAFLLLNTTFGNVLIGTIAEGFNQLLGAAGEGINFVFGGLVNEGKFSFFLNVLMPITFISALIGILQYTKILPFIIRNIGLILSKVNGMGKLESYNAVASAILGQSEVFISLKKILPNIANKRMYTLCASAMSTVSMSIVGAYMTMLEPRFVVTALVMNLFGAFIITSIINPYKVKATEDILEVHEEVKHSFFQMLGEYILDGFKVGIIVAAMLIGFVGLITLVNNIFTGIIGVTFQHVLGYIFSPMAFLMGIPWNEAINAGSIMATKIVTNEFVAMLQLVDGTIVLTGRSLAIVSVFLVSFANFSSIGIIAGAVQALNFEKGQAVAKMGLRLLYGATLVSILNGTIVSFMFR